jgi:hypothetical protein
MNKTIQDELITEIRGMLLRKYPDYVFKEIFEDKDVHFLGESYIRIKFWDLVNLRSLWVGLTISTEQVINLNVSLVEVLIHRIDSELKKFKEGKS